MEKAYNGRSALFTVIFFKLAHRILPLSMVPFLLLFLLLHTMGIPFFCELPPFFY